MGLKEQFALETSNARENLLLSVSRYTFQTVIFPDGTSLPVLAIQVFPPDFTSLNLIAVHLPHKKKQPPYF